jgi:hypothetical protein
MLEISGAALLRFGRGEREGLDAPLPDERQRARQVRVVQSDIAPHDGVHGIDGRLERNLRKLDAGERTEHLGADVTGRSAPGVRVVQLAGFGLCQRDQVAHRIHGQLRRHYQHHRQPHHQYDGGEILENVIADAAHEVRAHDHRGRRHVERVTVRRRARHQRRAYGAGCPDTVVDDHLLAPALG